MRNTFTDDRKKKLPGFTPARALPGLPVSPVEQLTAQVVYALACHQAGRLEEAEKEYRKILKQYPRQFDSLHLLGVICHRRGDYRDALRYIDLALKTEPNAADAHTNRAAVLRSLGRLGEALAACDRAIALRSDGAEAYNTRGAVLIEMQRCEEALASLDRAIALRPEYANAFINRGNALKLLKRLRDALASYDRALALNPDSAEAYNNRATVLSMLQRYQEALESCNRAIALSPDMAEAYFNRGIALDQLKKPAEALATYDRAIALKPNYAEAHFNRGGPCYELKRYDEALASYGRAIELNPNVVRLRGVHFHAKMLMCDWTDFEAGRARLESEVAKGNSASPPFQLLAYTSNPALQRLCAQRFVEDRYTPIPEPLWRGERYSHPRIRLAYLSADLREHPVSLLTLGLFEQHDRSRFETIAISLGPDEQSPMRARLKASFDRFIDVEQKSGEEIARLMRELEIDIAVDLTGYTDGVRAEILLQRPAPVQVNYLGYPGTLGHANWDYIIADPFVIPEGDRAHYSEKVVYLPDCFMVNNSGRPISARPPSRAGVGLPEHGFVFCSFNNSYKITPDRFDVWMRLLNQIEGSVLWLSAVNDTAVANLQREAAARGIAPHRLVFAPRIPSNEEHLARLQLADLFLDTRYYNAHATAADALWAGVPVLTCAGGTFASRVAGSLLHAVGLPELVTTSVSDYETLALKLARDPALMSSLRERLAANRQRCPLFKTDRFTRNLEAAYVSMWERAQRGEAPQSFSVAAAS